ncbi:MAG: methyltransferase, partial [Phenylobacterium sp.]
MLLRRGRVEARDLADLFGWNMPFRREAFDTDLVDLMAAGGILRAQGRLFITGLRVASVGPLLFLHSAFPPRAVDSVFFGPDSYRFVRALEQVTPLAKRVVDVGCGSGVGGIALSRRGRSTAAVVLTDINQQALAFSAVNAELSGV